MVKLPARKGKKQKLVWRSAGDQGFGEFRVSVNECLNSFLFGAVTWPGNRCMLVPDSGPYLLVCCTRWRLSASDSSGTVLFPKTHMVSKLILWYLVNVVESLMCTNVGHGTGTSTQLTHHLIAWFMWSCLRWARRFMIGLCRSSDSMHSERIRRPVSRTMSTSACRLCCIWTRKKWKKNSGMSTLVRRYRFDLDTPPNQKKLLSAKPKIGWWMARGSPLADMTAFWGPNGPSFNNFISRTTSHFESGRKAKCVFL